MQSNQPNHSPDFEMHSHELTEISIEDIQGAISSVENCSHASSTKMTYCNTIVNFLQWAYFWQGRDILSQSFRHEAAQHISQKNGRNVVERKFVKDWYCLKVQQTITLMLFVGSKWRQLTILQYLLKFSKRIISKITFIKNVASMDKSFPLLLLSRQDLASCFCSTCTRSRGPPGIVN